MSDGDDDHHNDHNEVDDDNDYGREVTSHKFNQLHGKFAMIAPHK